MCVSYVCVLAQDYAKVFYEERKNEEWFMERYLPSKREDRLVEGKKAWARAEGQRFKVQYFICLLVLLCHGAWA